MECEVPGKGEISETDEYFDIKEYEETNKVLEDRIKHLSNTVDLLKDQIKLEKHLWQKEAEQLNDSKKSTSANDINIPEKVLSKEPTLSNASLFDYDKKLSMYHEALVKSHIEKRMQLRRNLIANAYKRRLLEIENMCNVELIKVKQSVQNLQPLQAIVSEWNLDDEITGGSKTNNKETEANEKLENDKSQEMLQAAETTSMAAQSKGDIEIKEILVHNSPTRSSFDTTSSLLQDGDEGLLMTCMHSMDMYNNEVYFGFNPYI